MDAMTYQRKMYLLDVYRHRSLWGRNIIVLLFAALSSVAYGQGSWNWPEDRITAQRYHARYTDALKAKNYEEAREDLEWLIEQAPDLNKSIYQHGEIIYKKLAKQSTDSIQKNVYIDRLFELYDAREKYYGEAVVVSTKKAQNAYFFLKKDEKRIVYLLGILERALDIGDKKCGDAIPVMWLDILRRKKLKLGGVSDEGYMNAYDRASDMLDAKRTVAADDPQRLKRLEGIKKNAEKLLINTIKIDCEFIGGRLAETQFTKARQYMKEQDTVRAVKALRSWLRYAGGFDCEDDAKELTALELLYQAEPSADMAKLLGAKHYKRKNMKLAIKYYQESVEKSMSREKRAEGLLTLAKIFVKKNKSQSRRYARRALREVPTLKEAYTLIGSLYMNSYDECKQGKSRVEDRAVFLAAYDMFKKGGDASMMEKASIQFPSAEMIFELGLEEGANLKIDCWIGEEVVLRKAPAR